MVFWTCAFWAYFWVFYAWVWAYGTKLSFNIWVFFFPPYLKLSTGDVGNKRVIHVDTWSRGKNCVGKENLRYQVSRHVTFPRSFQLKNSYLKVKIETFKIFETNLKVKLLKMGLTVDVVSFAQRNFSNKLEMVWGEIKIWEQRRQQQHRVCYSPSPPWLRNSTSCFLISTTTKNEKRRTRRRGRRSCEPWFFIHQRSFSLHPNNAQIN